MKPYSRTRTPKKRTTIELPVDIADWLEEVCDRELHTKVMQLTLFLRPIMDADRKAHPPAKDEASEEVGSRTHDATSF